MGCCMPYAKIQRLGSIQQPRICLQSSSGGGGKAGERRLVRLRACDDVEARTKLPWWQEGVQTQQQAHTGVWGS
jgi:hypothetical protein